ncbi:MAG: enoyl-CoA hydratase/isomerase family protein [Deltaproteobacteria bacterium]
MSAITVENESAASLVTLRRPKVNALNEALVDELIWVLRGLEADSAVKAVILTGEGGFFSFGLDIPEFMGYSKEAFAGFIIKFTGLLKLIFQFPKPVVAALNGHAIAGGCMIALAADYRIMASEKAKISLNEITLGSTVFASGVEMVKHAVGARCAERVLLSGAMYSAEDAQALGLIDEAVSKDNLPSGAMRAAEGLSGGGRAFASAKKLLRASAVSEWEGREGDSIAQFVDIWYSEDTRQKLEKIKIKE